MSTQFPFRVAKYLRNGCTVFESQNIKDGPVKYVIESPNFDNIDAEVKAIVRSYPNVEYGTHIAAMEQSGTVTVTRSGIPA